MAAQVVGVPASDGDDEGILAAGRSSREGNRMDFQDWAVAAKPNNAASPRSCSR